MFHYTKLENNRLFKNGTFANPISSMNYLTVENLSKSFGDKLLFMNVTFGIDKGQKVALIAKNGTGKTTLLNIIFEKEAPDEGKVTRRNDIQITYLTQNPQFSDEDTVLDAVFRSESPQMKIIRNYEETMADMHLLEISSREEAGMQKRLQLAISEMDRLQAWDYESKIKEILTRLKIKSFHQKIGELSGGQKKRLALACVLIEPSDLIILDEPTNHLDIEMIEWLEEFLLRQNLSIFLVTHDRYFMEKVCNEILELDQNGITRYKGNYAYYLEKKNEKIESNKREHDKLINLYKKELDWMRRMPQARTTKSKSRTQSFYRIKEQAQQFSSNESIKLQTDPSRIGGKVIEMNNVFKSFDELCVVDDFTYTFKKGERIGICGNNGIGKSTFTDILVGKVRHDKGKVTIGQTITFGYFTQEALYPVMDKRVIDVVKDVAEYIRIGKSEVSAAQLLYRFGFSYEEQYNYVSALSGGEKRRLQLMMVLMKNPNFLILDEPTNDLDIQTLNALELFLQEYSGCLVIISHDRYFLDTLTEHLFVFEGDGKIKDFPGNYTEYSIYRKKSAIVEKKNPTARIAPKTTNEAILNKVRKLTYKETKELEMLESEIDRLESEKIEILTKMNSGEAKSADLLELGKRYHEIESLLALKTERWIELSEI